MQSAAHPIRPALLASLVAALGFALSSASARAVSPVLQINEATAKAEVTVAPLRSNISVLMGAGGNIVVLSGKDGKFLVDAGISVSKENLQKALADLGNAPPKYLVNTHWHWDHTDGNAWVHAAGATIIAHPKTLAHLSVATRVEDWDYTFQPWPAAGRPTMLVSKAKTMEFAGQHIRIENFGDGHTDGDLWVYFKEANVLVLGDIFWNGVYPFIDNGSHGGIKNMIKWVDKAIGRSNGDTIVVPGHGPVGTLAQLVECRDMLAGVAGKVDALKKQGKTLDEIVAAKPTADYDGKWGKFVIDPAFFTRLVYAGL